MVVDRKKKAKQRQGRPSPSLYNDELYEFMALRLYDFATLRLCDFSFTPVEDANVESTGSLKRSWRHWRLDKEGEGDRVGERQREGGKATGKQK